MKYGSFAVADKNFFPRPLWFWNERPTKERIDEIIDSAEKKWATVDLVF